MRGPFQNEPALDFSLPENRAAMRAALEQVKSQLGQRYPIVIGGERRETGEWIRSVNPGHPDQVVGLVAKARAADVEDAVAAAEAAYQEWRRMPASGRASVLFRMAAIIRRRKLELAAWMVYELDKPWDEAEGEVCEAIDFLEWYGRQALELAQPVQLSHIPEEAVQLYWVPLGVGVIIPPWNFPCAILTGMTMGPVAAGNTAIVKPASNTPVIGYKMFEIMEEAGVPAGVVNFLPGSGAEVGDALVDHPRVRFVNFTGSKDVGVRIYERAARVQPGQRWLKRVAAEMGGKDAIIVDADADLADAAQGIVASAFGFSGQKCSACSRAIVHADVYDEIVERVVALTRETVKVGSGESGEATVCAVVDEKQYRTILNYIEIGKQEGRLVLGGEPAEGPGYYIQPTIFADVPADARIACEEIFGPVLAIVKAKDFDEALAIANASEYGLTGSVYSRNRAHLERARFEFEVGNLYLNRKCTAALQGVHGFGGMKLSGTNTRAGGPDYLQHFMELKSVGERL
ncbi:L-glutamate gamma-semialdehyde dehydrogenase [Sphaerobacter thermophilus]|uniref:L-glutamate gamma-semialdehyde dehydrogenase n=1 Tax=Sphaerobacter thermophilus (strain ATCC 49802 / DSM 20745 / KCCM 41009 / NCIMB 13125 / S 6022) TaxID=479434 RepID=D1CAQ7_SPHTD|nr:L-glutamate gamma-semialdehyde dehydrogenase [Sphaerobacter thermophilus]ACZ40900.1 delta-1-pyrroline-5-carboxylate dehydrogenase [Sphaerobacter thermophilus DSM 20745]